MQGSLVSVIIPCFNAVPWIAETLQSVVSQTHARLEVVVVDDGSTDGSREAVSMFRDRGVRLIETSHAGPQVARNLGIAQTSGDFVQFLDADDLISGNKIETQLRALRARGGTDEVAVCPWARFVDDPGNAVLRVEPVWKNQSGLDFLVDAALAEYMFPLHAWLVPRGLCEQVGAWDERLSKNQDGEFFSRVLTRCGGIVFCEEARAYYRSGIRSSVSRNVDRRAAESDLLAWHLISATMRACEDSPRVRRAIATGYQRLEGRYFGRFADIVKEAERQERVFGGGAYRFEGGHVFRFTCRLFGWKAALRLRRLKHLLVARRSVHQMSCS